MRRMVFIARKEIYHILRDPRSLLIVFAMPVLMVLLYGYAINMDIENVTVAVVDLDHTVDSRALTERIYASTYFSPPPDEVDLRDTEALLRSGTAAAVLFITPGYGEA
ncbi:MAG: ABC transporter permease, partial [candidate division Zixibacteria bacterium]|nr:ABC transporter permease [candidate division Zixibacteria bacterium]